MSRATDFERIILGESIATPDVISNVDKLYNAIIDGDNVVPITPKTNIEKYLAHLIDSEVAIPQPETRLDKILCAMCSKSVIDTSKYFSENEKYLSWILERWNGVNMFTPTRKPPTALSEKAKFSGREITLNGSIPIKWFAELYDEQLPLLVGDAITLRYKYMSGSIVSAAENGRIHFCPYNTTGDTNNWATSEILSVNIDTYNTDVSLVTDITYNPTSFVIFADVSENIVCDNLKFEIAFEKGDTTQ